MNLYEAGNVLNGDPGDEQPREFTYEEYLVYKKSCEEQIELGAKAIRLAQNPDFISLVMEDYFVKEPTRLAALMASGKITGKAFDGCAEDMKSIGHLRNFLTQYIHKADIARNELSGITEAYNEAVSSGVMNPEDLN